MEEPVEAASADNVATLPTAQKAAQARVQAANLDDEPVQAQAAD
jgi:hypothetical protein